MPGRSLLDEGWLVVARLRDEGVLDLLNLLGLLDHSNWLPIRSYVLDHLLLPHDLMNRLLARYILVGGLYLDSNLPSPHFGATQILLTLKLLNQTTLYLASIDSFIGSHNNPLRRSILRIHHNILHLVSRDYNLISPLNLKVTPLLIPSLHLSKGFNVYLLLLPSKIILNLLFTVDVLPTIDHADELIHLIILDLQLHEALSNISNLLLPIPYPVPHCIQLREELNHRDQILLHSVLVIDQR